MESHAITNSLAIITGLKSSAQFGVLYNQGKIVKNATAITVLLLCSSTTHDRCTRCGHPPLAFLIVFSFNIFRASSSPSSWPSSRSNYRTHTRTSDPFVCLAQSCFGRASILLHLRCYHCLARKHLRTVVVSVFSPHFRHNSCCHGLLSWCATRHSCHRLFRHL